jgi:hypothetical protein
MCCRSSQRQLLEQLHCSLVMTALLLLLLLPAGVCLMLHLSQSVIWLPILSILLLLLHDRVQQLFLLLL